MSSKSTKKVFVVRKPKKLYNLDSEPSHERELLLLLRRIDEKLGRDTTHSSESGKETPQLSEHEVKKPLFRWHENTTGDPYVPGIGKKVVLDI